MLKLKNILRRNLLFVSWRLSSRGENPKKYIVQKGITDICIDGYPRSANSFSVRMFRLANPGLSIAHHTHAIANLKKSLDWNVPAVVLIRNPEQAILSSVIAHKKNNIDQEMERFIDFYEWVLGRLDKFVIAEFEQVVKDFNTVIVAVNRRYEKQFSLIDDVAEADAKVKEDIEKRFDKLGQSEMTHIKPVPTDDRNELKERLRNDVLSHPGINKARKLYNDIIQAINS